MFDITEKPESMYEAGMSLGESAVSFLHFCKNELI